ncbi:MAG: DUF1566 domain-containing protein [Candidatus Marinimicrobia bacterium]|nr:DUF1566 domain-containing protein [Candidatus Neomarinimicrobiota bacterium]
MDRFILDGEHAVIDRETNLMWVRTDSMNDLEKWVNYQESVDYIRNLCEKKVAGFNDWRLPSRKEMNTLYNESYSLKDKFEKDIHISDCFSPGGGFSIIAQQVSGRMRTFVLNLRTGEYTQPDGLWTLTEAARAVRTIGAGEKIPDKL